MLASTPFLLSTAIAPRPAFDKLKDGHHNTRLQELHDMPFGSYGQFYDKYGVQWIFKGDK